MSLHKLWEEYKQRCAEVKRAIVRTKRIKWNEFMEEHVKAFPRDPRKRVYCTEEVGGYSE